MANEDLEQMQQSSINLLSILRTHKDKSGSAVMGGLLRLDAALTAAIDAVSEELRGDRRAGPISEALQRPLQAAIRYGADDVVAITRSAFEHFETLDDTDALSPQAAADTMAWLQIAGQTRIALRVLFQAALLYGRAPNGQILEDSPS